MCCFQVYCRCFNGQHLNKRAQYSIYDVNSATRNLDVTFNKHQMQVMQSQIGCGKNLYKWKMEKTAVFHFLYYLCMVCLISLKQIVLDVLIPQNINKRNIQKQRFHDVLNLMGSDA